tara:strand:- start:1395 stop:2117 length:723 start_codon:yes stop_codon:yes gene_type:complete
MNSKDITKHIQIFTLFIITLYVSYCSVKTMRANTWYFNSYNTVQDLQNYSNEISGDTASIDRAMVASQKAVSIEPNHPHYLHFAAYVELLYLKDRVDLKNKTLHLDSATKLLTQSLSYRNSWADTWILLASVTSVKEGASNKVYDYINEAYSLAPFNYRVRLESLKIILINWQTLTPKFKRLYVDEIAFIYKHFTYQFHNLIDLADEIDALPILCLTLRLNSEYKDFTSTYKFRKHCNLL